MTNRIYFKERNVTDYVPPIGNDNGWIVKASVELINTGASVEFAPTVSFPTYPTIPTLYARRMTVIIGGHTAWKDERAWFVYDNNDATDLIESTIDDFRNLLDRVQNPADEIVDFMKKTVKQIKETP